MWVDLEIGEFESVCVSERERERVFTYTYIYLEYARVCVCVCRVYLDASCVIVIAKISVQKVFV